MVESTSSIYMRAPSFDDHVHILISHVRISSSSVIYLHLNHHRQWSTCVTQSLVIAGIELRVIAGIELRLKH